MKFKLYREQQLNCNVETAWKFFASPMNLSKITPKNIGFIVLSNSSNEIGEGMIIKYRVSPILHIPLTWITKIIQVEKNKSFTDLQEKGPYKYWKHFHEFISNEKGVLMKDTVEYELPLRILGNWSHSFFVRKKLESIFNYRYQIIEEQFNQQK